MLHFTQQAQQNWLELKGRSDCKLNILILSPTFPLPLNMGSKIRIYHFIKQLSRSNKITLASLVHSNEEIHERDNMKQYCSDLYLVQACMPRKFAAFKALLSSKPYRVIKFKNNKFRQHVSHLLKSKYFDIIWVNYLNMMDYLDPSLIRNSLIILDQQNADELIWRRFIEEGNWGIRTFARQNLWKLRKFQTAMMSHVDVLISVSEKEANFMKERVAVSCLIWTVPNGVDIEYFLPKSRPSNKLNNRIMFCGSMDVTMNIDAVLRFAQAIFPLVKEKLPDVEFCVVGRNPDSKILNLSNINGIEVTGSVEDIRPYYERARLVVAPFRYGGGTKLKILEAMAMRVPLVSTEVGCQGIEVIPGKHLLVENGNEQFAELVVKLLKDNRLQETLSSAGRILVEKKYGWSHIVGDVMYQLSKLVDTKNQRDE